MSMKDGLLENKLSVCSEGQLHKQLCLRICGSGGKEGRRGKNEAQGVIKIKIKKKDSEVEKNGLC